MADPEFIRRRTTEVVLGDGTRVLLRPIVPEDKERLRAAFQRLSPESRYRRFLSPLEELSPELLVGLTEVDYRDHFAWVALALDEPEGPGVGVSRYVRLPDEPEVAEAAVTVVDDHQGRGLGTLLLQALGAVALENGIRRFRGYVLESNRVVLDLLRRSGARIEHDAPGMLRVDVELRPGEEIRESPAYRALSALARGEEPPLIRWGAIWSPAPPRSPSTL